MNTNNTANTPSNFYNNSIFWIEVDKIKPNPYQPRKDFDEAQLKSLSDSIRQYGVLQALVVTRTEVEKPDGGLAVEYELIAGERRLRASRLAGLTQVPCLIKTGEENSQLKLELAIIENLQREDLNPVDRAKAFRKLADEFNMTHQKIAEKVGKSREYVSNTLRLLALPDEILQAVSNERITEGHARSLLMLSQKPEEQMTLFKEVMYKKLNVRETEQISRKVAHNKARKKDFGVDPAILDFEEKLSETLGTRVHIEKTRNGGKVMIDFFSQDDLKTILDAIKTDQKRAKNEMMEKYLESDEYKQRQEEEEKEKEKVAPTVKEALNESTPLSVTDPDDIAPTSTEQKEQIPDNIPISQTEQKVEFEKESAEVNVTEDLANSPVMPNNQMDDRGFNMPNLSPSSGPGNNLTQNTDNQKNNSSVLDQNPSTGHTIANQQEQDDKKDSESNAILDKKPEYTEQDLRKGTVEEKDTEKESENKPQKTLSSNDEDDVFDLDSFTI